MESKQNQNQLLFSFIKQEAYFTVNYKLVKHIGLNPSIFFGEICNEFKYYYEKNLLINDDWFFATEKQLQKRDKIHDNIFLLADVLNDVETAVNVAIAKSFT